MWLITLCLFLFLSLTENRGGKKHVFHALAQAHSYINIRIFNKVVCVDIVLYGGGALSM